MIKRQPKGFTIIELLIATAVFSVVLVIVTSAILQISRLYYKGINIANTQATARSVADIIAQAIQFNGGTVVPTTAGTSTPSSPKVFCIGDQRFTYALGWQVVDGTPSVPDNQTYHSLVQDTYAGCSSTSTQPLNTSSVSGRELINANMRLADLSVTQLSSNLYRVKVRIVYGDNDLLKNAAATNADCADQRAGTQFCSVANLSTTVIKRVQ